MGRSTCSVNGVLYGIEHPWKYISVADDNHHMNNAMDINFLCQVEACVKVWRQTVAGRFIFILKDVLPFIVSKLLKNQMCKKHRG